MERLIGEGTSGVVYRARHLVMEKPVAIKLLQGLALGSRRAEMEERFVLEARVYGKVAHPHVCAATDFGVTEDGVRFLVMELLEGRTLQEAIAEDGAMKPERAVAIAMQIADGLQAVHTMGVVHRDLKPENVFLVRFQEDPDWVKLVDFGIARKLADTPEAARLTGAGMIYGTPAYLAPEQTRTMDVDGRADLYALGVILFEMLAGRLPFERDSPIGFMQAHAVESPPRLNEIVAGTPMALARLVDLLLSKEPSRRPPDGETLRMLLAASLDSLEPMSEVEAYAHRSSGPAGPDVVQTSVAPRLSRVMVGSAILVGVALILMLVPAMLPGSDAPAGPREVAAVERAGASPAGSTEVLAQDPWLRLKAERAAFAARSQVARALSQLASNPQLTLNQMRDVVAREPDNAHAHYYLGLTHHGMGRSVEAAQSWLVAVQADPRHGHDPDLTQRLLDDFALADQATRTAAEKVLVRGRVLANGTPAVSAIVRAGMDADLVDRVHSLARRTGLLAAMPPLDRYLLILRAVSDCETRAGVLEKLSALDDSAALPALERLQASNRGCGSNGNDDCIACIRPALDRVIRQLKM